MHDQRESRPEESPADIIERLERETGQRFDANEGDNATMAGLFGLLARALGTSTHDARDDAAAGYLIRHQGTLDEETAIPWRCEDCGATWDASLSEFSDNAFCPECHSVHVC